MICRLCLEQSTNYLDIFSGNGQTEVAESINKFFEIEVQPDDIISNKICAKCWQNLFDFHRFWLSIHQKQNTLATYLLRTQMEQNGDDTETSEISLTHICYPIDSKNSELVEPEIDIATVQCNQYVDGLEFETAEFKDESVKINRGSNVSPLAQSVDGIPPKEVLETKSTKKKKSTKRVVKKINSVEETNLTKNLCSVNINEEINKSNNYEEPYVKVKEKVEETPGTNSLSRELDEFIAENTQLTCCLCSVPLQDFNDLKKHFRQVHNCVGYVICCNNRYLRRTLYVDHLKLHKDPDYFKCAICNKQLASRHNYTNHMNTKHPQTEKMIYSCASCSRKFAKQYILDYHLKHNHKKERNCICETCNKRFINSATLKQHEKVVHLNEYDCVCEICGKCLKTAQNLQTHMEAMHSTESRPEEQCTICLRWLKNSRCLKIHMMGHRDQTSGKKYKCPQCGVEKNTKPALAAHIRYHHSDKVFTCLMCNKTFKTPRSLREHESTHTGVDLYTCPFCPKTFSSHGNMHKHKVNSHSHEWVRCWSQPNETTKCLLNMLPDEVQS